MGEREAGVEIAVGVRAWIAIEAWFDGFAVWLFPQSLLTGYSFFDTSAI